VVQRIASEWQPPALDRVGEDDARPRALALGLVDRVEALGGQMTISSQPGRGTSLLVKIPLELQ